MTKQASDVGKNRTGIDTSPLDSKQMIEGAESLPVTRSLDDPGYHAVCASYAAEASPVGSVPPPRTLRGLASTALDFVKGQKSTVLIDKLGARLAFERTGVRLYGALCSKLQVLGSWEGGPTIEALREIEGEEMRHAQLIARVLREIGADPTAQTPAADLTGIEGTGLVQVLGDPRMDMGQSLHAILIAELTDNEGWVMLISLAREMGHAAMADEFEAARAAEDRHLLRVRAWLTEYDRLLANRDLDASAA